MGRAKQEMMEHQEHLDAAANYLVKVGRLEQCSFHGEIFGSDYYDLEGDFWRAAVGSWKRGLGGPVPWAADLTSREFTDLLKEAYETHMGDECGYCAKHRNE